MWTLRTADYPEGDAFTFRLRPGAVKTMGRAVRADFILDAPLVSRVHCRLSVTAAGDLEVEDLKSTNGTFVNDRRVRRSALAPGDRLKVGRVVFSVGRDETKTPSS